MNTVIDGVEYLQEEIPGKGKCLIPVPVEDEWTKLERDLQEYNLEKFKFENKAAGEYILQPIFDFGTKLYHVIIDNKGGLSNFQTRDGFKWDTSKGLLLQLKAKGFKLVKPRRTRKSS